MGFFDLFRGKQPSSAQMAKERLQIIVAHRRAEDEAHKPSSLEPAFLQDMKREILEVVSRYVQISAEDIEATIGKDGDMDVLELNINLPDKDKVIATHAALDKKPQVDG